MMVELATEMAGKAALVTGAGSGLGRAVALMLASRGAQVCIVDIDADRLTETAALWPADAPAPLLHPADLSDPDACAPAVAAAVEAFSRLDALCNVAGVIHLANTPEMPRALWDRTMAVNLTAPFLLAQAAIPHLLETAGAVVNVTSCAAFQGQAYAAAYCAAKAGLENLTKAMAMEYIRRPIRINSVAPGGMMTNIAIGFAPPPGAEIDLIRRFSPIRGLVEVEDAAEQVCMLAGPRGRGFHGACIRIDAGITAG